MTELDLDQIQLLRGAHDTREEGVFAMEAVAWRGSRPRRGEERTA